MPAVAACGPPDVSVLCRALSPEDAGWVRIDLVKQRPEVAARLGIEVRGPPTVSVTPVESPGFRSRLVAQLRDFHGAPVGAEVRAPWWASLHDRERVATHGELDPDLVPQFGRNAQVTEGLETSYLTPPIPLCPAASVPPRGKRVLAPWGIGPGGPALGPRA